MELLDQITAASSSTWSDLEVAVALAELFNPIHDRLEALAAGESGPSHPPTHVPAHIVTCTVMAQAREAAQKPVGEELFEPCGVDGQPSPFGAGSLRQACLRVWTPAVLMWLVITSPAPHRTQPAIPPSGPALAAGDDRLPPAAGQDGTPAARILAGAGLMST